MGEHTEIAWTRHTFNPWIGCMKVSAGCTNCYAEVQQNRWGHNDRWGPNSKRVVTSDANWRQPLKWNAAAEKHGKVETVFCASLADVFEDHPMVVEARTRLWELIRVTPWLHWQLLTKRPENFHLFLPADWGTGWANVWLGTSVESMTVASRVAFLTNVPAVVRFISYEPALGALDHLDLAGVNWLIAGGESGPGYRQDNLAWYKTMADKCAKAGVAFFMKQVAAPKSGYLPPHLVLPRQFPVPAAHNPRYMNGLLVP